MYRVSCALGEDVVFDHIVFAFAGTSVQVSPRGWKTHV